jgi:hypothetical protein
MADIVEKYVHPETGVQAQITYRQRMNGKHLVIHHRPVRPFDSFPSEREFDDINAAREYWVSLRQSLTKRGYVNEDQPYKTKREIEDNQRFREMLKNVGKDLRRGPFPWSPAKTPEQMQGIPTTDLEKQVARALESQKYKIKLD